MGFSENYNEIYEIAEDIYLHPELGYKEFRTSGIVENFILKYAPETEICRFSRTGLKVPLPKNGENLLNMVFLAELDAVYTPAHFHADENTGAAHNCGHYSQVAIALSLFKELILTREYEKFDYNISFVFVPAEEFLDLEYRKTLRKKGEIKYFGGKPEGMRLGIFDEFDFGIAVHSMGGKYEKRTVEINSDLAGFIYKNYTFIGKAAHAGFAPHEGVNAYSMSTVFNTAVGLLRQHFDEREIVRLNPVILNHKMGVNVIPQEIKIGCDFRAQSVEYMTEGIEKLDNAAKGAALSMSGKVETETCMGYLPFKQDRYLSEFVEKEFGNFPQIEDIISGRAISAAGDIGDLSYMFPCIQIGYSGFKGTIHGTDFIHEDSEYIFSIFPDFLFRVLKSMSGKIDKNRLYKRNYKEYEKIIQKLGGEKNEK
ncbi:MAG: M20/M25/M40 family metallo-hydrolase [Leptotrichiaceae bacterium]|nr:M20/M25/M40 family metallo-hydrolase [Leptotrichiaceae bacterium]